VTGVQTCALPILPDMGDNLSYLFRLFYYYTTIDLYSK
jgi:hypothetical protein